MRNAFLIGGAMAGSIGAMVAAGGDPPRFVVTDLGSLGETTPSAAFKINDAGQIVGEAAVGTSGYAHAVTWIDGRLIDLTGLGVSGARANGLDAKGRVVGMSDALGLNAFIWEQGPVQPLPFEHSCCSEAMAINSRGWIVGKASLAGVSTPNDGVIWIDGKILSLGTLGADFTSPNDINDAGVVVGITGSLGPQFQAFSWQNGRMTPLPGLGNQFTEALAISEKGLIVGYSSPTPVVWENGAVTPLPSLGGFFGQAEDVNDAGWIVGVSTTPLPNPGSRAVLWIDGEIHNLNSLLVNGEGVSLAAAHGVNNHGEIVGQGVINGLVHGFKLTPVAPADLNADAAVNGVDLGILLSQWFAPGDADLNDDGQVNGVDLGILLAHWTL